MSKESRPPYRPINPCQHLETPPPPSVSFSSVSPPPVVRNGKVEVLEMPDLGYSPDGKSIYEKNPHPLAYNNRSISIKNHPTTTRTNTIQEEESHDTSTIGSTEGSEDMLLSTNRRRRSNSFDAIPVPRIKLRPRYTGMTGISSREFRSHIANSLYGQGHVDDNSSTGSRSKRMSAEPTHLRAHTFSSFDSSSLFDDMDTTGTDNIVDFGGRGVWAGSTPVPLTPQVKLLPPNAVKRTGPLNASQHSFGSTFSSSTNSAFEPSKISPPNKSHSDKNSSSPTPDNLHGFRFIDDRTEPVETSEEDAQVASMHCMIEGMEVRQNPNTPVAMPATTRPRSSSGSTSPATATATTEYTSYSNRHRHHRRSS